MRAIDFIKPNENVVVLYTNGTLFELNDDNTALTGDWKIDPSRSIDRVIVYLRGHSTNNLYIGNYAGVALTEEKRYKIKLTNVQYIGRTELNWNRFADTQAQPVRYLP